MPLRGVTYEKGVQVTRTCSRCKKQYTGTYYAPFHSSDLAFPYICDGCLHDGYYSPWMATIRFIGRKLLGLFTGGCFGIILLGGRKKLLTASGKRVII